MALEISSSSMGYMLEVLEKLINTPSVVGYTREIHPLLEELARAMGYEVEYDHRRTAYIRVPGKNEGYVRMLGAHLDTIGMVVRHIDDNGWLLPRNLGGINVQSLEGENVFVHTRFNGNYTGTVICKHHSAHVYDDAKTMERDVANMRILLDEEITCKQDVLDLGIRPGDLISMEPRYRVTDNGFIKSRHIDDKANAAVLLEALRQISLGNIQPAYETWFAFPIYEEIGLGGGYVPEEVDEYTALDIGVIGETQEGDEHKVSIGAADRIAPYDWDLTSLLVKLAEEQEIGHAVDVYYRYASDATSAMNAGQNIVHGTYGVGCMTSHGYERCHQKGLEETLKLTLAYIEAE